MNEFSIKKTETGLLQINSHGQLYALNSEEEEILKDGQLIAGYEAIAGIAVNEAAEGYKMEIKLDDGQVIVLAEQLAEEQMRQLVQEVWTYLGLEM
jgi:hypothetical protein